MLTELEKEDVKKLFDDAIQYHIAAEEEFKRLDDKEYEKIHQRKAKTFLKAIVQLGTGGEENETNRNN